MNLHVDQSAQSPMMEHRVCIFLDLLGFQAKMAGLVDPPEIQRVVNVLGALNDFGKGAPWIEGSGFMATQFSDSLVMSFRPAMQQTMPRGQAQHRMALAIQQLTMQITKLGFLVRGGASLGPLYHTVNQVFGQALVDAYHLERDKAKFPRIMLTPEAKEAIVVRATDEVADAANRLFWN